MAVRDIGIYFPEWTALLFKYNFRQSVGTESSQWSYYQNIDDFISSSHQRKVACFQAPYPYENSIEKEIDKVYDSVDAIVVVGNELHSGIANFMRRYEKPKIRWFICGFLTPPLNNGRTYPSMDWFKTSVHFYKHIRPSTLYELNPFEVKPLMFDALLGRKKRPRDQAHQYIKTNNLIDKGVVTYIGDIHPDFHVGDESKWIWETDGLSEYENVEWTVDRVNYYGYKMSLSQIIPINIYNQTAYSLVCETNCDNDYVFFTEKTVKPILARRLFIMIGGRYQLARLRDLGFRTFNGIIDESYDEIERFEDRHQAALEQLNWLCKQPQEKILDQCREIVTHNFNVMYTTDWYDEFKLHFRSIMFNQYIQN